MRVRGFKRTVLGIATAMARPRTPRTPNASTYFNAVLNIPLLVLAVWAMQLNR